ncbi:glycine oxidase ThiO [Halomonas cerina]|uniref:Glycine oxidase n=1 Tax=Halomonas cerina TaxID=447424 RepID=A0A839V7Y2_9GAMM|nr:glycine oxidase ThiO [Halomonas cerina]MBB3189955.1 glycine oxidase [Halomonas cerina]
MQDVLIIGGGVIGMMTAWQLAEDGLSVTLLERGEAGREASWAGGGIVSPLYPWRQPEAISRLSRWSESRYPHLADRLIDMTGIDPEYRQNGLLYLDTAEADMARRWAQGLDTSLASIDAYAVYAREPGLVEGIEGGLWMPTLGSLRNPRLVRALRALLQRLPRVDLCEGCAVQRLITGQGRVKGAVTAGGRFMAGRVVVCGGAWTNHLLSPLGLALPVRPVKGQMMVFKTPVVTGSRQLLERVVLRHGRYLIPRADGRVLVGSTLEEAGFDKTPTREARDSLHASAVSILPALAECEIEHHWSGLRPGTPDGLPFIGEMPDVRGLFINAGHYRNGLVLAPASARLLADEVLGRRPVIDPRAFQPIHRLAPVPTMVATD